MRLRESVRALILDPDDNVLLVHFRWDGADPAAGFWANPGGGLEPGESRLAALQRELREETGLTITELGPEVWTKTAIFPMTRWDGQVDHIHLLRTARFRPAPTLSAAQLAAEHVQDVRWWSRREIAEGGAVFAPRQLPRLLDQLLADGVPDDPVVLTGF